MSPNESISKSQILFHILGKPSVYLPTVIAMLGAIPMQSASSWGSYLMFFGGFSYFVMKLLWTLLDSDEIEKAVREIADEIVDEKRLEREKGYGQLIAASIPDMAGLLSEIETLRRHSQDEMRKGEASKIHLLEGCGTDIDNLAESAFRLAARHIKLREFIQSVDFNTLAVEERRLMKALDKDPDSPLKSALQSTREEMEKLEELKTKTVEILAQVKNIRTALRTAQLDILQITSDSLMTDTGESHQVDDQTVQLRAKLKAVRSATEDTLGGRQRLARRRSAAPE